MSEAVRKYIMTVIVGAEQGDDVERTMLEAAELLNARLTRGDFEPADEAGYYRKTRSRTLRKQGRLE